MGGGRWGRQGILIINAGTIIIITTIMIIIMIVTMIVIMIILMILISINGFFSAWNGESLSHVIWLSHDFP